MGVTNVTRLLVTIVALANPLASAFGASEGIAPTTGKVYGTKEARSLSYDCEGRDALKINCKFVVTAVRPKERERDFTKWFASRREDFLNDKPPAEEDCSRYRTHSDVLQGRVKAPKPEGLAKLSVKQRKDVVAMLQLFVALCDKPIEQNKVAMARFIHGKDTRTCFVSSHTWEESYEAVIDGRGGKPTWVARGASNGPCGIIELNRFESEQSRTSPSLTLWNYFSRKAITNPTGELQFGGSCSKLDQEEYPHLWTRSETQLDCDYIEFSHF